MFKLLTQAPPQWYQTLTLVEVLNKFQLDQTKLEKHW